MAFPPLASPNDSLMSPTILEALQNYADTASDDEDEETKTLARIVRPTKSFLPRFQLPIRKTARLLNPIDVPLPRVVPPSLHLQCDTTSSFLRSLPESRSAPSLFQSSVSKHGLPLQASGTRNSPRIGEALDAARMRASLDSSIASSSGVSAIRPRKFQRRGHALMLSGGAPLEPDVEFTFRMLQVASVRSFVNDSSPF